MSDEYEYSYDWDIRYCYENSNVLRNKLGIIDANALRAAEREIAAVRVLEAERTPIRGKLDFKHLCDIHRYLFGDIFEWAGKLRTVNIAKGNPFCNCGVLDVYGAELFGKLKAENYLLGTPPEHIPERLAYYLSEINVLHPFREGNGRSQRLFIEYLSLVAGYRVDFTDVTAAAMIEASVRAFDRDEVPMCAIFKRITTPINRDEQQTAVRAIAGARSEIAKMMRTSYGTQGKHNA
ncbi:MAG: Fic family protein [Oscillospiraceae bacterium]|jgi:cell filamentation protein|nr:Fic family protein [Oscillospiraceae bacterium]